MLDKLQDSYVHIWFSLSHHTLLIMVSQTLNAKLTDNKKKSSSSTSSDTITLEGYAPFAGDHHNIRMMGLDIHKSDSHSSVPPGSILAEEWQSG
jgi:hypothetical protein